MNELLFIIHSIGIALAALGAAYLGKEALTSFVLLTYVLANLLVIKQITLFGYNVTSTDAFIVGSVLALNLLNEYFCKQAAQKALWIAFSGAVFFTMLTQVHLLYIPNQFDATHYHFSALFEVMPRIMIASLISYFISQRFENYLYTLLKQQFSGNYLVVRNYMSMSCSQLVDTFLFSFLGLYGIVENIGHIIFVSYCIKLLSIFIVSPLSWLSTYYMKKAHEIV